MSPVTESPALIDRLPDVRGRYGVNSPLAPTTWFRVGGPAEVLFRPADLPDLQAFLAACPKDVPVTVIGVASNLLVRDGGVPGVVIRLGGSFASITKQEDCLIAGAGALDLNVATTALQTGLGGLEFLSGIPGTMGGALRMNAGAYGREIKDVFVSARALDRKGRLHTLTAQDMGFAYRHSHAAPDLIFIDATLKGHPEDPALIEQRMADIKAKREAGQPIRTRTGGSTFANPDGAKAWELVDKAGFRGFKLGGAQVSELHTNFLINTGGATAADLEDLGEEIRRKVKDQSGYDLRWEIQRIGVRKDPA